MTPERWTPEMLDQFASRVNAMLDRITERMDASDAARVEHEAAHAERQAESDRTIAERQAAYAERQAEIERTIAERQAEIQRTIAEHEAARAKHEAIYAEHQAAHAERQAEIDRTIAAINQQQVVTGQQISDLFVIVGDLANGLTGIQTEVRRLIERN
jgi:chromosome segregation ATPase